MALRDITGVDLDLLQRNIRIEFPAFRTIQKTDSWLMKLINLFLLCVTFGQAKTFMTTYTTTVGYTVYVPNDWDSRPEASRAITLRHERVHMRQRLKHGQFIFSFLYLFVLPFVRALYRKKFEQEAYEETLRAMVEYYGEGSLLSYREQLISHFTDSSYLWMWTKRSDIETWYETAVARILSRTK